MISFEDAILNHANVAGSVCGMDPKPMALASVLWSAVQGVDGHESGSYSEALYEAAPSEYAVLLSKGEAAASHAWMLAWRNRFSGESYKGFELRRLAVSIWGKFAEKAKQAKFLSEGFGCDDSEAWEHERDSGSYSGDLSRIHEIAELAGRMYHAFKGARQQQPSQAPEEIYSVTLGAELSRLLPSELAHLGQPTEICLIERLAERKALCYAVRGQETTSRGPLVMALDESSSMHAQRTLWSKAAAIALARVALEDGRPVTVIRYSTAVAVIEMKPGDLSCYMKLARGFLGGGTRIGRALSRAAIEVERMARKGDKGADVVIVTDGETGESLDPQIDEVQKVGARLWTVSIEVNLREQDPLRARAERYTNLGYRELESGDVSALSNVVNPK
jgi:hypothetical protein